MKKFFDVRITAAFVGSCALSGGLAVASGSGGSDGSVCTDCNGIMVCDGATCPQDWGTCPLVAGDLFGPGGVYLGCGVIAGCLNPETGDCVQESVARGEPQQYMPI